MVYVQRIFKVVKVRLGASAGLPMTSRYYVPYMNNIRCEEGMGYILEDHFVTLSRDQR